MKKAIKEMFSIKMIGIVAFYMFSLSISAFAADYYVKTPANGGNDATSGLNWTAAKATIGAAMALVDGSDTIHVAAGTYNEKVAFDESNDNQLLGGYPAGGEGAQEPWNHVTAIDGTGLASGPMISIPSGDNGFSGIVVDGFTIRNGTNTGYGGAGIESYSLGVSITRNIIEDNQATGDYGLSGGIYFFGQLYDDGRPVIEENIIRNNSAAFVGGIYLEGAAGKTDNYVAYMVNNLIAGNESTYTDGGVWGSGTGGIVVFYPASASMVNCTLADNTATHSTTAVYGIHVGGYTNSEKGILAIANSIIWHPSGDDILLGSYGTLWMAYCDVEDSGNAGGTVISEPPDFVGGTNYHLTADSPCIDAGANQGTVVTSTLTNKPSLATITWGDGIHDLHNKWESLNVVSSAVYGHLHATYPSDSDVEKVSPPLDITTYNASGLNYHDLYVTFMSGQYIFFQGLNGYYGAWRVDSINSTFKLLSGQTYFQCNGSANFDAGIRDNDLEGNVRLFEGGLCEMGAYEYIPKENKGTIAPLFMLLLD